MRLPLIALLMFTVCVFTPASVSAQESSADAMRFTREVGALNEINIKYNAQYNTIREMMAGRIIDSHNKVVGDVEDILINAKGAITVISASFNRLRLPQAVPLNVTQVPLKPLSNGYSVAYNADQLEEMYPGLLESMAPAAGGFGGDAGVYSTQNLKGATIETFDGVRLARVHDVYFPQYGTRAEALSVSLLEGRGRGKEVAIPLSAVNIQGNGANVTLTMNDTYAAALHDYIRD